MTLADFRSAEWKTKIVLWNHESAEILKITKRDIIYWKWKLGSELLLSLYGGEFFKPRIKQLTLIIFGPPIVWAKNEKKCYFLKLKKHSQFTWLNGLFENIIFVGLHFREGPLSSIDGYQIKLLYQQRPM